MSKAGTKQIVVSESKLASDHLLFIGAKAVGSSDSHKVLSTGREFATEMITRQSVSPTSPPSHLVVGLARRDPGRLQGAASSLP